jgi:hypothetical protein
MKKIVDNYILITIIVVFFMRYCFEKNVSIKYVEIVYLFSISIILFCLFSITKSRYNNMSTFFILTFLLIGLLPYLHYLNYTKYKENYSFNNEYLEKSAKLYKEDLKNYKDSVFIFELKSKFYNKVLNVKVIDSLIQKKQIVGEYTFVLKNINYDENLISGLPKPRRDTNREDDRGETLLDIYKNNQKITSLKLESKNIKTEINRYILEKNILNEKIKNPKQYIPFSDIWLDSVTGFVFSFIKPLSKTSQIIRLFQLLTAYFLFYMFSSWLKLSKKLNITEINK